MGALGRPPIPGRKWPALLGPDLPSSKEEEINVSYSTNVSHNVPLATRKEEMQKCV